MKAVGTNTQPGPFRVFFGDEDLLLDQALDAARNQSNREVILIDGDGLLGEEIISIFETRSMSGADRGIIIDNAQKVKHSDELVQFLKERDGLDRSVVLVAIVRSKRFASSWLKAMEERGKVVEHAKPKPWNVKTQLYRIQEQATKLGVRLDKGVPELLTKVIGYDLKMITNELRKLAYLVEGEVVTTKHVALLIPHVFPAEPYEVAEAAFAKQPKKALNLLGFVYRNLGEGAAVPVGYSLMRLLERVLLVRQMSDVGDDIKTIAMRLGMHEYACQKNLLPLARLHSVGRLKTQMRTLCRLDSLVKGPARSKRTQVELALLAIAT
jgi:DNA polymerase III delta subunit